MTSPVFRPAPPVPASWAPEGGWYNAGANATRTSPKARFATSQYGPVMLPGDWSDEEARQYIAAYDEYIAKLERVWSASDGLQRRQINEQIKDAQQARANEIRIAQLNAETSRYGTDARRQTEVDQLKENRRQFDLSHGVEMERLGIDRQRLGLDVAKAYTEYASTPDRLFMLGDLDEALQRQGMGVGPQPYGTTGTPRAKTYDDFAVLMGGGPGAAQGAAPGGGADPRVKAATSIIKEMPPSQGDGLSGNDFAVLGAIRNLMETNWKPGDWERFRPGQQKAIAGGGARLGYYVPDKIADYKRSLPGQGSVRQA